MFCLTHGQTHSDTGLDEVTDELGCLIEDWPDVVTGTVLSSQCEPDTEPYYVIEAGDLVYLATLMGGLVPAKLVTIEDEDIATIRITGGRPGFTRGQRLKFLVPNLAVLARPQVQVVDGRLIIDGPARFVDNTGRLI